MNPPAGWTPLDIDDPGDGSVPRPDRGVHAVAVLAASSVRSEGWSPRAALEIARGWGAAGTRVVLFDVGLEEPSLHTAAGLDNLEGVSDALLFGSSFQRLAQPLSDRLFLATAGTAVPDGEALRLHPRWRDYVEGFRDAGAVLVLYLPHDAPGADALLAQCDAVVVLADPDEAEAVSIPGSIERLATVGPSADRPVAAAGVDDVTSEAPAPVETAPPDRAMEDLSDVVPLAALAPDPVPMSAEESPQVETPMEGEGVPVFDLGPDPVEVTREDAPVHEGPWPADAVEGEPVERVPLAEPAPEAPADVSPEIPGIAEPPRTEGAEPADAPAEELPELVPLADLAPDAPAEETIPISALAPDPEPAWAGGDDAGADLLLEGEEPVLESEAESPGDEQGPWAGDVAWADPGTLPPDPDAVVPLPGGGEGVDPLAATDPLDLDTAVGAPAAETDEPVAPTLEDILADQPTERTADDAPAAVEVAAATARTSKPVKKRSSSAPLLLLVLLLTVLAALIAGWLGYVEIPFITPAATGTVGTADAAEVAATAEAPEAEGSVAGPDGALAGGGDPGELESPVAAYVLALGAFGDLEAASNRASVYRLQLRDVQFIVAPVEVGGTPYYRLLAGPAADSAELMRVRERLTAAQTGGGADDWIIRPARLAYLVGVAPRLPLAERNVEILRELGIPAHVLRYTNAEGTTAYRVYSGAYADNAEAAYLGRLLEENSIRNATLTERRGLRPE